MLWPGLGEKEAEGDIVLVGRCGQKKKGLGLESRIRSRTAGFESLGKLGTLKIVHGKIEEAARGGR